MRSKTVFIGLIGDRIDLLVCQGERVVESRRLSVKIKTERSGWANSIRNAAAAIRTVAEDMKIVGSQAIVLYRSPTDFSDCTSLNAKTSAEARQSAIIGCTDSLTVPIESATMAATVVGRDSGKNDPQTHVVVTADAEEAVDAIATMVETAGFRFQLSVPLNAVLMARLAMKSLSATDECRGYLYIGEHRSFFMAAANSCLLFARPISLGIDTLAACLTRPIRNATGSESIELGLESARRIIQNSGFPESKQVLDDANGLTAGQILPMLQPVLQRFVVEVRQSLRFGVDEEHRHSMPLILTGPGSSIPRFATILAEELQMKVSADQAYQSFDCERPDSPASEMMDAIRERKLLANLNVVPSRVAAVRDTARLRKCLLAGAAAALLIIGFDALGHHTRLNNARTTAESMASRAIDVQALMTSTEKLRAAASAINRLDASIAHETGASMNLRAYFQELSRLTPESIKLTSLMFQQNKNGVVGSVNGYAFDNESGTAQSQLEPYMEKLRSSPLFERVQLVNMQIATLLDTSGQRFEAGIVGIKAPVEPVQQSVEAGGREVYR